MRKYSSYYSEVDAGLLDKMRKLSKDAEAKDATKTRKQTAADAYYKAEEEKQAHRQMLREEALKIYAPLRKVAVVVTYALIACLIIIVGYLIGWMIYQLYLLAPWSLFLVSGTVTLLVLLSILSSGSSERPPNWTITVVEWRLNRQMKKICEQQAEHDKMVEQQEAQKIENQLL